MPKIEPNHKRVLTAAAIIAAGAAAGAALLYRGRKVKESFAVLPDETVPQPAPKPGDILLFHNARGTNHLAAWLTLSPFYHAAVYAGNDEAVESRPKGVVKDSIADRANDFIVVPAPAGKGKAALKWAESKIGDGYDNLDIGVIVLEHIFKHLHLNYTPPDKFTCGEFVARAFDAAGVRLFPEQDLADTTPADFARLLPKNALPPHLK